VGRATMRNVLPNDENFVSPGHTDPPDMVDDSRFCSNLLISLSFHQPIPPCIRIGCFTALNHAPPLPVQPILSGSLTSYSPFPNGHPRPHGYTASLHRPSQFPSPNRQSLTQPHLFPQSKTKHPPPPLLTGQTVYTPPCVRLPLRHYRQTTLFPSDEPVPNNISVTFYTNTSSPRSSPISPQTARRDALGIFLSFSILALAVYPQVLVPTRFHGTFFSALGRNRLEVLLFFTFPSLLDLCFLPRRCGWCPRSLVEFLS